MVVIYKGLAGFAQCQNYEPPHERQTHDLAQLTDNYTIESALSVIQLLFSVS